jgi:hypothetical protein
MEAEENEEIKSSCRTTKTILHGDPFIKDYIYKLVTATSGLEARGNLIFTYAVLRCNEGEAFIPAKMFSQSFMTACIRTAGLREESTDKAVGYDPCAVCLHYMTEEGARFRWDTCQYTTFPICHSSSTHSVDA